MGQAGAGPDDLYDADDLMDLLLQAYARAGHTEDLSDRDREVLGHFAEFCNSFLYEYRVASTGVVDGGFALVFEDGQSVQPASGAEQVPERPEVTIAITRPKDEDEGA